MSETVEKDPIETPHEDVSVDDLRQMLEESRGKIASLERERDDERANRTAAERDRDTATSRVVSEAEQRWLAQKQAAEGAVATADAEAERAEREYTAAAETGDWSLAAKAQRAIATAAAKGEQARGYKQYLENNKPVAEAPRQQSGSGGGKYASLIQNLHPGEAEWLDQRPQFVSDARYRTRVFGASQIADGEGHARGTPAYFARMEELLGEGAAPAGQRVEPRRGPAGDIAPQRRASPNAAPRGGAEIRLTADQAEVADALYGNPGSPDYVADQGERYKKYHANMERMRASGRYN